MDSIGQLSSSLPPDFESKQLQASFRQAALSITDLFKQGKRASAKGASLSSASVAACPPASLPSNERESP